MAQAKSDLVLVVEDELLIQMDAVEILQAAGFRTEEATSALDAMTVLERRDDVAAVFTDIQIIGDPDGLRLAHMIRDRWPPMGLIMTSGRVKVDAADMPSGALFLPKPYNADHLVRCLQSVIKNAA